MLCERFGLGRVGGLHRRVECGCSDSVFYGFLLF